jgi:MFS family permease
MSYVAEFRSNWRPLAASTIGSAAGLTLGGYTAAVFSTHLITEFGWERSQFALLSMSALIGLVTFPLTGRLVDLFGPRRVASFGIVAYPLCSLALSAMNGDFIQYYLMTTLQVIVGSTTTSVVYTRFVAAAFKSARGSALAVVACGPAVVAAITAPILSGFIDAHGWRAGYQLFAAISFVLGATAFVLMPRGSDMSRTTRKERRTFNDYGSVMRMQAFWFLMLGVLLCNLPQSIQTLQLQLVLMENGATTAVAASIISIYAIGIICGRILFGLALDRFPSHIIAALGMALPAVGMGLLLSNYDTPNALGAAVLLIAVSQGAEGDLFSYLVARHFNVQLYGSVFGIVTAGVTSATALGALLLSFTLDATGTFALFISIGIAVTLIGALAFLLLGRIAPAGDVSVAEAHAAAAQTGVDDVR